MSLKHFLPMGEKPPDIYGGGRAVFEYQSFFSIAFPPFYTNLEDFLRLQAAIPSSTARPLIVDSFLCAPSIIPQVFHRPHPERMKALHLQALFLLTLKEPGEVLQISQSDTDEISSNICAPELIIQLTQGSNNNAPLIPVTNAGESARRRRPTSKRYFLRLSSSNKRLLGSTRPVPLMWPQHSLPFHHNFEYKLTPQSKILKREPQNNICVTTCQAYARTATAALTSNYKQLIQSSVAMHCQCKGCGFSLMPPINHVPHTASKIIVVETAIGWLQLQKPASASRHTIPEPTTPMTNAPSVDQQLNTPKIDTIKPSPLAPFLTPSVQTLNASIPPPLQPILTPNHLKLSVFMTKPLTLVPPQSAPMPRALAPVSPHVTYMLILFYTSITTYLTIPFSYFQVLTHGQLDSAPSSIPDGALAIPATQFSHSGKIMIQTPVFPSKSTQLSTTADDMKIPIPLFI